MDIVSNMMKAWECDGCKMEGVNREKKGTSEITFNNIDKFKRQRNNKWQRRLYFSKILKESTQVYSFPFNSYIANVFPY